jgi:glycosyltransferase involved in cell wall biosynthesis
LGGQQDGFLTPSRHEHLISLVLPDLRGGGAERVQLSLAEAFLARGYSVDIVVMQVRGELLPLVPVGAGLVNLKAERLRHALLPLARYLRRRHPDALLAAMWPLTSIAVWARCLARAPTRAVLSDHNDFMAIPMASVPAKRLKLQASMRWSYPQANGVVAVSGGVARSLAELAGMPIDRVSVIHNPVRPPTAAIVRQPCTAAPEWANFDGPRLIAVGSLKPAKDFALLLDAFTKVQREAKARLLILGEGPLRAELEALRNSLGLDGAVDMPGFVIDPYPYLARADVFVLSSAWEGFGNVIVEALGCGTPVVSTDCPSGPGEILEGGRYGKLVPVGDAEALARAILATLSEDHDRDALIRRARDFSVDIAAERYLRLLLPDAVR